MNYLDIKNKLIFNDFKLLSEEKEVVIFGKDECRLKFIDQRLDGWECYLCYGKNYAKIISIGFMVFIFSKVIELDEYIRLLNEGKQNMNLSNFIFDKGGLVEIIENSELESFISFYEIECINIFSALNENRKK